MKTQFCNKNHRVFPELNSEVDYPFFCPQCDENYYGIELTEKDADLEVAHTVESSNGTLELDSSGNVTRQDTNEECGKVVWFDLEQYEEVWGRKPTRELDILDLRGIMADGRELMWSDYKTELYSK